MPAKPSTAPKRTHHYVRTPLASLLGFIAVGLIMTSIVLIWLGRTVTDTGTYVNTVGSLVGKPAVQDFAVEQVSSALLNSHDEQGTDPKSQSDQSRQLREMTVKLLGKAQVAGKTDEQLRAQLQPVVETEVRKVVSSSAFAELWRTNNRAIHDQLIAQLKGDSSTITLNFRPLITGIFDELSKTKLSFVKDDFELPKDAGVVKLQDVQLSPVRRVYNAVTLVMVLAVLLAVLATAACVWVSVHHWKTLRRVLLLSGVYAAVLALLLGAPALIKGTTDDVQQRMVFTVVDSLTSQLRLMLVVVAVLLIGGVLGYKLYGLYRARKPARPPRTSR